ncbi:MAG: response regulator [Nitrospirae bacterium]|nr:response regulator [Nitrospirota bacterium]
MPEELKANVLIVDDEEQFLNVFSQRLKGRGLTIDTAASGEEAIKHAKDRDFDAIVLDMVMPGLGGIETLKRLRTENPDLQIIILTGYATVEKGVEAIKEGAVDFMEKPVDINKLMERIGAAKHKRVLLVEKKAEEHVKNILQSKGW